MYVYFKIIKDSLILNVYKIYNYVHSLFIGDLLVNIKGLFLYLIEKKNNLRELSPNAFAFDYR